ncbi:MAG: peptidyl-prolyl cis-trans isomerase [Bryobacteraceae bacterium]
MTIRFLTFVAAACVAWAQAVPPSPPAKVQVPPETVVAIIDGEKVTAAEMLAMLNILPAEARKNLALQPKAFLSQVALMKRMARLATEAKLDQQSPVKEQLAAYRMMTLVQAQHEAAANAIIVSGEDQKKFYEENKSRYEQRSVKVIYLSFSATPNDLASGKKQLSEAKAKAEQLATSIRGGADFVKLVKANSDDAESVARDGDFGTLIRRSDNTPDAIKTAIFALKQGDVSDPVRSANGYYLFKLAEINFQNYDQVRDDIFMEIRQGRFNEWIENTRKGLDVKVTNEEFFAPAPAVALPPLPGK